MYCTERTRFNNNISIDKKLEKKLNLNKEKYYMIIGCPELTTISIALEIKSNNLKLEKNINRYTLQVSYINILNTWT
ncbi:28297_t:CDS:1, partial [Gigaspora margarita]